jgi:hypothetical protein
VSEDVKLALLLCAVVMVGLWEFTGWLHEFGEGL